MAVERTKEFVIDLDGIVKARLKSFSNSRKRIRATKETEFQRRIIDEDLSFQEQLDYRQAQLGEERTKTYPDVDFIEEIETSITSLKKLVRARKFRDNYFSLLQDLASGRKSLEDHLEFLKNTLEDTWDRDIRDEIQEQIIKVTEDKRDQDRKIINSQITFYQKDNTSKSLKAAMDLVRKQLFKPEIQRDNALRTSYEQQLATLKKEELGIDIEDKANWMAMEMVRSERKNPSLWKLETFSGFRDKAGTDTPVNIGGTRYNSEREYWQTTLNNYIQSDFANEYAKENKNEATLMWNKLGLLPTAYLRNLVTKNNMLRTNPELQPFQTTISSAIQDTITNALDLKSKDLIAKYYLDKPDIATTSNYEQAKQELENLKNLFGADYSLSPDIQKIETLLLRKKAHQVEAITSKVKEWRKGFYDRYNRFPTTDELSNFIETQKAVTEVEPEEFKEEKPEEVVEKEMITKPKLRKEIEGEVGRFQKELGEVTPAGEGRVEQQPFPTVSLQPGARGTEVKKLQDYLVSRGYMTQAQVDTGPGIYGPRTKAAVAALQSDLGVDTAGYPGYWGPRTRAKLAPKPSYTPSEPSYTSPEPSYTPPPVREEPSVREEPPAPEPSYTPPAREEPAPAPKQKIIYDPKTRAWYGYEYAPSYVQRRGIEVSGMGVKPPGY